MPVVKEQLKILQIEMQIKLAHSWISLADILSRPVAFDLLRACLHGGGGLQVGEVTRLGGVARLFT